MLKPIIVSKLSRKHRIKCEAFPGATTDDMAHYIKPGLRRKPDKIIIHAGTNDLKSLSPKKIQKKITSICPSVQKDHQDTKIAILSIITRKDDPTLLDNIAKLNQSLKNYCDHNNIDFIDNSNITVRSLAKDGLHLNKKGIFEFSSNLRSYINSDNN